MSRTATSPRLEPDRPTRQGGPIVADADITLAPAWDNAEARAWCSGLAAAEPDPAAVVHRGRNTLWRCVAFGRPVVVKRFAVPRSRLGRLLARVRPSKAARSFRSAQRLIAEGFATPEPLAAVDLRRSGRLVDCFYCCADQAHQRTLREVRDDASPAGLALARDIGAFVARLHRHRLLHGDLNATNVLLLDAAGDARFCLIDLNRLRVRRVGIVAGLWNLQRLSYA